MHAYTACALVFIESIFLLLYTKKFILLPAVALTTVNRQTLQRQIEEKRQSNYKTFTY